MLISDFDFVLRNFQFWAPGAKGWGVPQKPDLATFAENLTK